MFFDMIKKLHNKKLINIIKFRDYYIRVKTQLLKNMIELSKNSHKIHYKYSDLPKFCEKKNKHT